MTWKLKQVESENKLSIVTKEMDSVDSDLRFFP